MQGMSEGTAADDAPGAGPTAEFGVPVEFKKKKKKRKPVKSEEFEDK